MEEGRAKRQKVDKKGRLSALERLKQLKGGKNKYQIDEVDNVYEEVDEREYSKKVLERQDDDWIVDDDGTGYVEDGRDIFDDDMDVESIQASKNKDLSGPRKKKAKERGNIRNMIVGMSSSKKDTQVKLEDDEILKDLMAELRDSQPGTIPKKARAPNKFLVSNKSKIANIETKSPRQKPVINNAGSVSQEIDNDIEDEDFFPSVKKIGVPVDKLNKKSETKSKTLPISESAISDSQLIDDTSDTEPTDNQVKTQALASANSELSSMSQIIDDTEEDISCYTEDLSNFDFEDSNQDFSDKLKPANETTQSESKPKDTEPQPEDKDILNADLWDDDFGEQMSEIEVSIDKSQLPLHINEKGEKVFRFYWWDAFEDYYKQPGIVYLFGKVYVESAKAFISCCVTVKNIDRRIYLLPREHILPKPGTDSEPEANSMMNVYKEFNEYATKNGIKTFRSCTVTKNYAFEVKGVPKSSEYLEVRYSAREPSVPADYSSSSIERVFGTTVNSLELLLIEKKIKGPCWLDIKCPVPTKSPISWCKIEVDCVKPGNLLLSENMHNIPPPPLVVATLNIRTTYNTKSHENGIAMIGVLLHHKYHIDKPSPKPPFTQHFCLITKPEDMPWVMLSKEYLSRTTQTEVIYCDKERDLLEEFLNRLQKCDPDLLVGYDCGFQFEVLMHRMINLRVPNWSRISRLKRNQPPFFKRRFILAQLISGRPVCDIQTSAKELNIKVRSYDLQSLCINVLKKTEGDCKEIKPEDTAKYYSNSEKVIELVRLTMIEASYIIMIMFDLNVMPLALQITCIAGNVLSRTLSAGRAERNEYLLLHAFDERGYITPDKRSTKGLKEDKKNGETNRSNKKAAYAGGLVLEPKKGFYDTLILLMDFNSLYPSIIQEYNICFTTVPGAAYSDSMDLSVPETDLEPGVIPNEIRKLVESRSQVKNLMKVANISAELKLQYNIRQLALKLTANSMYGCLGATHSRFYAKGLAALVTAKGREILVNTKDLVERLNHPVIYGDTDSLMINTNVLDYEQVFAVGKKIKQEVNKLYKKVELDIDGVFRYLLLFQKKKYAAVSMTKLPNGQLEMTQEIKGLDIIRRDWCQLACEVGRKILDQLLCDQPFDTRLENIFDLLRTVSKNLKEGKVPLSSLVITKQLSKNPSDYSGTKQVHVTVALRLNEKGGRMWKAGDTVPYVICEDGTDNSATERAYHIDELKNSETLKVDINYYLLSQLFPVIMRICEPIEAIDDVLLSEHLGLTGIYKPKQTYEQRETLPILDEEKYKNCDHFIFYCQNEACRTEIDMSAAFSETSSGVKAVLLKCPNSECRMPPWRYWRSIQNQLQLALRSAINQYYVGWMECEDPMCGHKTRRVPQQFFGVHPVCDLCQKGIMYKIYTETRLYNQITFYHKMFDINQPKYKDLISQVPNDVRNAYNMLREFVEKQLRRSAYSIIDLTQLFSYLDPNWRKAKVLQHQNTLSYICSGEDKSEKTDSIK